MLGAIISFLIVYAIYALIAWLRNPNSSPNPAVAPHKRIARSIWIYCVVLISVAIIMVSFTEINRERFYRPMYVELKGRYFPDGYYSYLCLGSIHDNVEYDSQFGAIHSPRLMGQMWEELPNDEPASPYKQIPSTFHTYDSERNSKSYGRGMILRVYNFDGEIFSSQGNEKLVYKNIIDSIVTDSSLYQPSKKFAPYSAIETPTYAYLTQLSLY